MDDRYVSLKVLMAITVLEMSRVVVFTLARTVKLFR